MLSTVTARLQGLVFAAGIRILMYHSIADNPNDPHAVSIAAFSKQMDELAQHSERIIDLPSALHLLKWEKPFVGKCILTFDDAYSDFLLNAVPILQQHQLPATLFVPTGMVGGTSTWDSYDKSKSIMTWEQLAEVHRFGFTIASHSVTHPNLSRCDDQQLEYELRHSLATLREKLGDIAPILSYPGGKFSQREMIAAKEGGYIAGVGVASHWANYPWTNRYSLRRSRWNA